MKIKLQSALVLLLLFYACGKSEKKERASTDEVPEEYVPLRVIDKGLDTMFLDETANFQSLGKITSTSIGNKTYISHFYHLNRTLYIYDMESGRLVNKIQLAREGPNQVNLMLSVNYFISSLDSIFLDISSDIYYLVNAKGEVMNRIGNYNGSTPNDQSVFFDQSSYFQNNQIHGSIRMPFKGSPIEKIYARASITFQEKLKVSKSVRNEDFIQGYDEIVAYRTEVEKRYSRLNNMPRHFAYDASSLYATTPLSDSIYIFQNGELTDSFYAGIPDYELSSYEEFVNFSRSEHKPGEVRNTYENNRKAYYTNLLIDPAHKYIYRLLIQGTKPLMNSALNKAFPEVTGASLVVINLDSKEVTSVDLPIEAIKVGTIQSQIFVGKRGVYFIVKDQENEEQVELRIFGINRSD